MTQDEQTLLMIKGVISDLPKLQRQEILDYAAKIKADIQTNPLLGMAIALVGAELQMQGE